MFIAPAERTGRDMRAPIAWQRGFIRVRPFPAGSGDQHGLGRHDRVDADFPEIFMVHGMLPDMMFPACRRGA